MRSRILYIAASFLLLAGCLRNEMQESIPILEVNDVILPSDYEVGEISAIIPVRSNGSWSANILEDCFWAELSETDHINPSRVTDEGGIRVVCKNNDKHTSRSFRICVSSSSFKKYITVTQNGKNDRIRLTTPSSENLVPEPESQTIEFYSNTFWSAGIKEGSDIGATLSVTEGYGDGKIEVAIDPNYEMVDKKLTVVIETTSLEPVEIEYYIAANVPFIRPDEEASYYELLSSDTTGKIVFKTNDSWTACILGGSDIDELTLASESGTKEDNTLEFSCSKNESNTVRMATIRIIPDTEPALYVDLQVSQLQGFAIRLNFENSNRPFVPLTADDPEIPGTYGGRLTDNELHNYYIEQEGQKYNFSFKATELCFYGDTRSTVLWVGKGYIILPAIEGKRLTMMRIIAGNGTKTYSIYSDLELKNIVQGGIGIKIPAFGRAKWRLSDTQPGKEYYVKVSANSSRISDLALIYE